MNPFDLHPDGLLVRAERGELTESEAGRLARHVAACALCRFEQSARRAFEEKLSDVRGEPDLDTLVTRALSGAGTGTGTDHRSTKRQRSPRMAPLVAAAVASIVSIAGVAGAARMVGIWPAPPRAASSVTAAPVTTMPPLPRKALARNPDPGPAPPEIETNGAGTKVIATGDEPVRASASAPSRAAGTVSARTERRRSIEMAASRPLREEARASSARSLFASANEARIDGRFDHAVGLYGELLSTYPESPEANLAHVTLGRLFLDRGDNRAALRELDVYVTSSHADLREEAMVARAVALSRLGRTSEEREAWAELLKSYPESSHAARARLRLESP
jgi:TolA-binding protein